MALQVEKVLGILAIDYIAGEGGGCAPEQRGKAVLNSKREATR